MYTKKDIKKLICYYNNNRENYWKHNKYLNEGYSRVVFSLDNKYIIKISKENLKKYNNFSSYEQENSGIEQSLTEIKSWKNCPNDLSYLLNPIIEYGMYLGYIYIIQEKVKIVGLDNLENNNLLFSDETLEDIRNLCDILEISINDIVDNTSNIGINSNNEIVIVDYGYC